MFISASNTLLEELAVDGGGLRSLSTLCSQPQNPSTCPALDIEEVEGENEQPYLPSWLDGKKDW